MRANDLRKGDRVIMRDGTEATVLDNRKGQLRRLEIWGDAGETYVHEIAYVLRDGTQPEAIELSAAQIKRANMIKAAGF